MEPKVVTFKGRIKRAIKAFKGQNVGSLQFGIDVKRCDECEYRNGILNSTRDYLLITAGRMADAMSELSYITLPDGINGEHEVARVLINAVDIYILSSQDEPFDLYIEDIILDNFGNKESED